MKCLAMMGFMMFAVSGWLEAPAETVSPALPQLQAQKTAVAPIIDGRLTESCWQESTSVGNFWKVDGSGRVPNSARAWVAYDDRAIYLAFRCPLPDGAAVKKARESTADQAWSGDTVEVFLAPFSEYWNYYQFAVNAANGRFSQKKMLVWTNPWTSATSIDEHFWSVELAIPFASLADRDLMKKEWRINLTHGASCWAPTFLTYHQPDKFGRLTGLDVDFKDYRWSIVPEGMNLAGGEASMVLDLQNFTGRNHRVDLAVTVTPVASEKKAPFVVHRKNLNIGGRETGVDIKIPVTSPDPVTVQVDAVDTATRKIYAHATQTVCGPQPVRGVWDRSYYMTEKSATLRIQCGVVELAGGEITCSLCPAGKTQAVQIRTITLDKSRNGTVTFDLQHLSMGTYLVIVSSVRGDYLKACPIADPLQKLAARAGAVQYTDRGVLLRDGKPMFPFGVNYAARYFAKDPQLLKDYRECGFNTINLEWMSAAEASRNMKDLDACDLYSIVGIPTSPGMRAVCERTPEDLNAIRNEAQKFIREVVKISDKKIFGWYTWDEATPGLQFEAMRGIHQTVKATDPYHPTFTSANNPMIYPAFYAATDIMGPDPYPNFPGGNVRIISGWMDNARRTMKNKPIIVYLQSFYYDLPMRVPNALEVRCMAYLSIVHDANGIMFFSYDYKGLPLAQHFPETWNGLKRLAREIRTLEPVLVTAPMPADDIRTVNAAGIDMRLYEENGSYYLLAVNGEKDTRSNVQFSIKPYPHFNAPVEVMFENRSVAGRKGTWSDTFEPLAVHIYRIGMKK